MIYIVIGLVITVLVIVISSVKASDKQTPDPDTEPDKRPEPLFPPEPSYQITDLYEVNLDFKGTNITIHNVKSCFKGEKFMMFMTKNGKKINYKIEDISYYTIKKSGSYKEELPPGILRINNMMIYSDSNY